MKEYELGLICGRFSHIHKGHQLLIDKSLEICKNTIILVGSAQESNTLRNPFTSDYRIKLIKKIYNCPEIKISELQDMTNEYDVTSKWGQYVIDKTIEKAGKMADVIISGNDESRKKWFSKEQTKNVKEIFINKNNLRISATELRGYLLINDKKNWSQYVSEKIIDDFEEIRNILLEVPIYRQILNNMGNNTNIEKYKEIYQKYEIEDRKEKIKHI